MPSFTHENILTLCTNKFIICIGTLRFHYTTVTIPIHQERSNVHTVLGMLASNAAANLIGWATCMTEYMKSGVLGVCL